MTRDSVFLLSVSNGLRAELAQLDLVMKEYAGFLERYADCMDVYLHRAAASFMTDFYLCAETVFTIVADKIDGGAPRGRNWRKRLLASMATANGDVRPAVISPKLCAALTPFLVFRHAIPQAYGSSFDENQIAALEKLFPVARKKFSAEMRAFCAYLERKDD